MVSLNANRKKIQQLYAEKTGKAILMKDIHNIATRAKQQKREDNLTVSNNELTETRVITRWAIFGTTSIYVI